jgi:hypothetical protein
LNHVEEKDGVPGLTAMRFITNASQSGQHSAAQALKDKKKQPREIYYLGQVDPGTLGYSPISRFSVCSLTYTYTDMTYTGTIIYRHK